MKSQKQKYLDFPHRYTDVPLGDLVFQHTWLKVHSQEKEKARRLSHQVNKSGTPGFSDQRLSESRTICSGLQAEVEIWGLWMAIVPSCQCYYFQHPLIMSTVSHSSWGIISCPCNAGWKHCKGLFKAPKGGFGKGGPGLERLGHWSWTTQTPSESPGRKTLALSGTRMWFCSDARLPFRLSQNLWSGTFCQKSLGTRLMNVPSTWTSRVQVGDRREIQECTYVCAYVSAQLAFGARFVMWPNFFQTLSK